MRWSWKLGEIAGIGIYIHWTFLLLFAWFIWGFANAHSDNPRMVVESALFVLALFGCVLLHELGHALTARHYQIQTKDITLLPIGGLACLERMPEDPIQELWVAFAGPAVNIVLAAALLLVNQLTGRFTNVGELVGKHLSFEGGQFLLLLMSANVLLALFNLLPAFPMDGGRVFRAILALRMDYARATRIAASVGQAVAILFGVFGFMSSNFLLMFIAIFVYLGAEAEARGVELRVAFRGVPVRKAMMTRFRTLTSEATLGQAVDELLAGAQHDFPVVESGKLAGILFRADLFRALKEGGAEQSVGSAMRADCPAIEESAELEDAVARLREKECPTLAVLRMGELVGVLTLENIGEWLSIRSALEGGPVAEGP